ncbi:MAG: protease modulator HflK [Victivallaceae bacterium]|nr:protease modulator HflK [Victivallaceae bacterium]
MNKPNQIGSAIDDAAMLLRLGVVGAIVSAVLALPVLLLGTVKTTFAGSDVFAIGILPYTLAFLFSLAAILFAILQKAALIEEEEKLLLAKRKESTMLSVEEDVRFTAGRSFANFQKYAPYVLTILAALITGAIVFGFYRGWGARVATPALPPEPMQAALVSAIIMFASIFVGAFYVGQARRSSFRWLRPLGAWLIAGFAVMFVAMIVQSFYRFGVTGVDRPASRVILIVFGVLGVEFIFNFVVEFYRPRTLGEVRPIFESRFLALFTEPGGVMRNIADMLDYQFGFKVSGTWIFGFVERSLFPLLLLWAAILWSFTCIHEVGPSEVGVRERFGRVVEYQLLDSGIYFTLPWPFGRIATYSCSQIHSVTVGSIQESPDAAKENALDVILWTKQHTKLTENNFLVAVEPEHGNKKSDENVASYISFVGMTMPIQYHIRRDGVFNYAYRNRDSEKILTRIGEAVATRYLASCSMNKLIATGRHEAEKAMFDQIQLLADQQHLGIQLVAVNLLDVHPPVDKVAQAYQDVIGAMEEKESKILEAKAYSEKVLPESKSKAMRIVAEAGSYQYMITRVAKAESGRFSTQLASYLTMPSMFRLRSYLDFLEKDCADMRKFIISSTLDNEIYELNFEEKPRMDLVDASLDTLVEKK